MFNGLPFICHTDVKLLCFLTCFNMVFEDIEANLNPNLANLIPVDSGIPKLTTHAGIVLNAYEVGLYQLQMEL